MAKSCKAKEAEFIVIYGRRRVGKTYLVREYFTREKVDFFHATGVQNGKMKTQLSKFVQSISDTWFDGIPLVVPGGWDEAFKLLHTQIEKSGKKVVVFLDELPWMATPKSNLLETIEYYWNHYWSRINNLILITCGSSASWLIKKIIYNKGGLHNRITGEIYLTPFSLAETKAYLKYRKVNLNDQHILSLYLAIGGIPYYLNYVEPGLTAQQNIQNILFNSQAPLRDEFNKLFHSLFAHAEAHIELVELIAMKKSGMTRAEIEKLSKLTPGGGRLTSRLRDLTAAGFIQECIPWGQVRGEYYKLIDEFCLFYLHWIAPHKGKRFTQQHWINQSDKPAYSAWSGYAFEGVCLKHVDQIVDALNIQVNGPLSSWRFIPRKQKDQGAQIDLLVERNDHAVTLFEIKYTDSPFRIDKQYAETLRKKVKVFKERTKTERQIFITLISANGLKESIYSEDLLSGVITLKDLMKAAI